MAQINILDNSPLRAFRRLWRNSRYPSDTRTAILETSAQLFADLGYGDVSMRDVAFEVGVTPANLYHHFNGKDDLIRETVAHVFSRKTAPISELLESKGGDVDGLELFVERFVNLLTEDRVFFRQLLREMVDGDEGRMEGRSVVERPFRLVSGLAETAEPESERFLATVSIVSLMLGRALLKSLLAYLPGARPDHSDSAVVVRHVSAVLRRAFHSNAKDN